MTGTAEILSIGELALATGTKVPTIRYYETIGLLPPAPRSDGNQRRYTGAHQERLAFIRHARALGFEVAAIRDLLRLVATPDAPCAGADAIARRHLADVEARIAQLTALKAELARMVACGTHGTVSECRVVQALGEVGAFPRRAEAPDGPESPAGHDHAAHQRPDRAGPCPGPAAPLSRRRPRRTAA